MAGELWRSFVQVAKESSYGAGTQPATRRMFYESPHLALVRQPRPHAFATGTRDNVRSLTVGPQELSGEFKQPLDAGEIIELLLAGIAGGVTPTQPNAGTDPTVYLWTFAPGNSLDSMAAEWQDGALPWLGSGILVDKLNVKGSANGPNDVTATLFGKALTATTMTGSLATRTPDVVEGWQSQLWVDSFGGTPGTTLVNGTLINWDVTVNNQLARKYFAQLSNSLAAAPLGALMIESILTFEAAAGEALTAFNDWNVSASASPTKRLVRLDFGETETISHAYKQFVTVDIPGAWSVFDLGQTDANTRVYRITQSYVYDPTNTFGIQIRAQNTRSTAW